MIPRKQVMSTARTQDTDARCQHPRFSRKMKRIGARKAREMLRRDLASRVAELEEPSVDLVEDFYDDWDWFDFEPLPPEALGRLRRIYREMKDRDE